MDHCILHVEDDENDILLLELACKKAKISVPIRVVYNGEEAAQYIQGVGKFADRDEYPFPSIILLDLKMPRKTGLEFLEWLRAQPQFKSLIVIMFTSSARPEDIDEAYELGVNSFVVKPSGVDERAEILQLIQRWWLHYNQLPSPIVGSTLK